jgi:hypothetical protein
MAGYVRQSANQIYNGADITAPPLNAEFNRLEDAFDASTGHSHDGTTGQAPKIDLTTSVSGYLPSVHGGVGGKNNLTATTNPVVTNDSTEGYAVGSMWENTTTGRVFICIGNTASAAVWRELVQVNGTSNAIIPEVNATTDLGTPSFRFQDAFLSGGFSATGNSSIGGTFTALGTTTLPNVVLGASSGNAGSMNGVSVGATNPQAITGTVITSNSGFVGDINGSVTGNVTASSGTSSFTNISASGTITGDVTGDITGNVTAATGTSTFNDVTISGTLNMDGATTTTIQNLTDPTNPQDAATKNYTDTQIANLVASAPATLDTLNEIAASLNDDADFAGTMTTALAGKVADTGDTMTGNLIMSSGATVTGVPLPVNPTEAASKAYTDQQDALQLSLTGGTMSGSIAMGSNSITGVPTPTASDHGVNKNYVDTILGSTLTAAQSAADAATSESNAAASEQLAEDWAIKTSGTVDGTNYSAKYWATSTDVVTVANNVADISTVAGISANVTTVASINTDVATVSGISSDVSTVAANDANVTTVAGALGSGNLTLSGNGSFGGTFNVDGASTMNQINLGDSDILYFGNDNDLEIFHGVNNFIRASGVLNIQSDTINISKFVGGLAEYVLRSPAGNDAVYLYYGNASKLETTDTGIEVTGRTRTNRIESDTDILLDANSGAGTVTINGNLTVTGTTTTINSTTLDVEDLNITVASTASTASAADGAGLTIQGANVNFEYDYPTDSMNLNRKLIVADVLEATGDIVASGTGAVQVPSGTEAQRPTAANGMIRYNADKSWFEGYSGGAWGRIVSGVGDTQSATTTSTTQTAVASYSTTGLSGIELTVVATDTVATERTITKLLVTHDGTTAVATQYGEVNTNTAVATYDVDISGGNIRLLATAASANSTNFTTTPTILA